MTSPAKPDVSQPNHLKIIIGAILGFLTTGLNWPDKNGFSYIKNLPINTILIICLFGLCGGIWVGLACLKDRNLKKLFINRYVDLYSYFLVGCSSVSVIGIYNLSDLSVYDGRYVTIYFFGFVGIGLVLSGAIHLLNRYRGDSFVH